MSAIPLKYLKNMGGCRNMNVHGETVTVRVDAADSSTLTDNHISDFRSHLERINVKVVGVDAKRKVVPTSEGSSSRNLVLALYASNRCLIFHLVYDNAPLPKSFQIFHDPNTCFVGPTELLQQFYNNYDKGSWSSKLVSAGELAARVLKKPGLTTSDLATVAQEVGVKYDGPSTGTRTEIQVDSTNPMVLSEEMIKTAINDAVAHYLIGCKLLSTIDEN